MSFNKANDVNNISKSQSLTSNKDNNNNNNKIKTDQTLKKNKIINIRIYQNYSTNKNSK